MLYFVLVNETTRTLFRTVYTCSLRRCPAAQKDSRHGRSCGLCNINRDTKREGCIEGATKTVPTTDGYVQFCRWTILRPAIIGRPNKIIDHPGPKPTDRTPSDVNARDDEISSYALLSHCWKSTAKLIYQCPLIAERQRFVISKDNICDFAALG